jgi:hypothetical protein
MANNVNETKARTIVLDSLKSTIINASSIHLTSEEVILNGTIKKTYPTSFRGFGNINSNTMSGVGSTVGPNLEINESEILNGLIVIHEGTPDKNYTTSEPPGSTENSFGNVNLPRCDSLRYISVNQSVDFSIINNMNSTVKIEDNQKSGYSVIGHPSIYTGTSALFKLHRNNDTNYNVYRLA